MAQILGANLNDDFDHGDLETKLCTCVESGPNSLYTFVQKINEKREKKHRQYCGITEIARRKSEDLGISIEEMTWSNQAREQIMEGDARLKQLQERALNELEKCTHHPKDA